MMTKNADKKREQMLMFCMDDMVPQNHMLRLIDKAIDWNFIYDLVEEKYCPDNGRPSMDPVMLIKIPFIQYLYGIKSMRQTMKAKCTESKDHVKLVTQYVWERYIEKAEDIRHTLGNKEIYQKRKETIERIFGTAKEHHGFRNTQYIGKAQMEMKAGLTFACMNLKKLAKILVMRNRKSLSFIYRIEFLLNKINAREKWCLA